MKAAEPGTIPPHVTGLVVLTTRPGRAGEVARIASTRPYWEYWSADVYLVMGVRWAAAVAGDRVILDMRALDPGQLDVMVKRIKEEIPDIVDPGVDVVETYYKDGRVVLAGHDGLP